MSRHTEIHIWRSWPCVRAIFPPKGFYPGPHNSIAGIVSPFEWVASIGREIARMDSVLFHNGLAHQISQRLERYEGLFCQVIAFPNAAAKSVVDKDGGDARIGRPCDVREIDDTVVAGIDDLFIPPTPLNIDVDTAIWRPAELCNPHSSGSVRRTGRNQRLGAANLQNQERSQYGKKP